MRMRKFWHLNKEPVKNYDIMLSNINENTTVGQYTSDISVTQSKFVITKKEQRNHWLFVLKALKKIASIMESPIHQQMIPPLSNFGHLFVFAINNQTDNNKFTVCA